ncbi:hypothetical protein TSMEX_008501 [Taenia solium]|eukprot:TsM_001019600 transcript=TsM_001019600 gene=TsM_001019600
MVCQHRPEFPTMLLSILTAKKFAYRLQHIYCEYMDGLQAKLSTVSVIIDEVPILESIDKSFHGDELIRCLLDKMWCYPEARNRPILSRRSNSSVDGLKNLERWRLHGIVREEIRRVSSSGPNAQ